MHAVLKAIAFGALSSASLAWAAPASEPALDLLVSYYTRVLTDEGVTREANYTERMLRRPGHVWVARVVPARAAAQKAAHGMNAAVLPRHVRLERGRLMLEYVDLAGKAVVAIAPPDYANVGFEGAWESAYALADPARMARLPVSTRASAIAGAQWREREKDGLFERVLWDKERQLALVVESGDTGGRFYRKVQVAVAPSLTRVLPWEQLGGYARREYADYLD